VCHAVQVARWGAADFEKHELFGSAAPPREPRALSFGQDRFLSGLSASPEFLPAH
jgi:hypothetical protein